MTRFGNILKVFGQYLWLVYLIFDKLLYQLWHFYAIAQIVIDVNGQRLNNNIETDRRSLRPL